MSNFIFSRHYWKTSLRILHNTNQCHKLSSNKIFFQVKRHFPGDRKEPPTSAGDLRDASSILGSGRSPGGGHGEPLQYSCLENPMNREVWWVTVHRVAKSWT